MFLVESFIEANTREKMEGLEEHSQCTIIPITKLDYTESVLADIRGYWTPKS